MKCSDTHTCSLCHYKFGNRQALRNHLENFHVRSQTFSCDLCPKFYFLKQMLRIHMDEHRQRSFECKFCNYKTSIRSRLENHEFIHAAKVDCPVCSEPVSNLKRHMRTNHELGVPKEACPICSKVVNATSLQRHLRIHEDEKNYVCEKCSDAFKSFEFLRRFANLFSLDFESE